MHLVALLVLLQLFGAVTDNGEFGKGEVFHSSFLVLDVVQLLNWRCRH